MKKVLIISLCSIAALTLVGCGSKSDKTLQELNNQLSRTQTNICEVCKQDNAFLSEYSKSTSQNQNNLSKSYSLASLKSKVAKDIYSQSNLTTQISNKTKEIQATLKNGGKKYSKNQINAIKSLTKELANYTDKIKSTKQEAKNGVSQIKQNQKENHISIDGVGTGYNTISNVFESRKAYYNNILNTLSQIDYIVSGNNSLNQEVDQSNTFPDYKITDVDDVVDDDNNASDVDDDNAVDENDTNTQKRHHKHHKHKRRRNINIPDYEENENQSIVNNNIPNSYYNNYNGYLPNAYVQNGYGYGYGMNGYNGTFNGRYGTYGFYGRNTDTYRPDYINIDTYRLPPTETQGGRTVWSYTLYLIDSQDEALNNDEQKEESQDKNADEQNSEMQNKENVTDEDLQTINPENSKKLLEQNKNMNKSSLVH